MDVVLIYLMAYQSQNKVEARAFLCNLQHLAEIKWVIFVINPGKVNSDDHFAHVASNLPFISKWVGPK